MDSINSDFAKLATTASVLVNSAAANSNVNDMLQRNKTFTTTFESRDDSAAKIVKSSNKGLIGLLAKHGDDIRVAQSLRRSNFTSDGKKKKDFNILSNDMLNEIIESTDMQDSGSSDSIRRRNGNNNEEEPTFSLFQGFSAVLPEVDEIIQNIKNMSGKMIEDKKGKNKNSKNVKNIGTYGMKKIDQINSEKIKSCQNHRVLLNYKSDINYHLDLLEIRKGLGKREISEIDAKIDRLYNLRKEIFDNVTDYEKTEIKLENQLLEIQDRLDFIKDINNDSTDELENDNENKNYKINDDENNDTKRQKNKNNKNKLKVNDSHISNGDISKSTLNTSGNNDDYADDYDDYVTVYMEDDSRSYSRVTSSTRTLKSGDQIHKFQAHNESINCLAFDEPYGKLVTCSMDSTVRVWDMNRYKCVGLLEGHNSYVDCLEVCNNLVFTGSMDASVKMWDLDFFSNSYINNQEENENENLTPLLNSFEGHVDPVTSLTYSNGELISGSDDKTIRQWDLTTGHLIQTIDVMWASSMANSMINFGNQNNLNNSNINISNNFVNNNGKYPYMSCLQVFDAALASGSNDGIVRLWDLRSGDVIRQLFGHTGAVTTLQFDKSFSLVTGSADRSVRIWDLRTGNILDSFSYENPIKKIMFDDLKIASVVENERGVHIYDRTEQRHWIMGGDVLSNTSTENEVETPQSATFTDYSNDLQFAGSYLVEGRSDGVVGVWNV